jgi:hypothetical protein
MTVVDPAHFVVTTDSALNARDAGARRSSGEVVVVHVAEVPVNVGHRRVGADHARLASLGHTKGHVLIFVNESCQLNGDLRCKDGPGHEQIGVQHLTVGQVRFVLENLNESGRHVETIWNDEMPEIALLLLVEHGEPANVKDGDFSRKV